MSPLSRIDGRSEGKLLKVYTTEDLNLNSYTNLGNDNFFYVSDTVAVSFYSARSDIIADSLGNLYFSVIDNNDVIHLFKYNSSGELQWEKTLDPSPETFGPNPEVVAIRIDSLNNIYVAVNKDTGDNDIVVVKYNSITGSVIWQQIIDDLDTNGLQLFAFNIDSEDNLYFGGNISTAISSIVKLNSAGVIQWQKDLTLPSGTGQDIIYAIAFDSSGNLIAATTGNDFTIVKLNSSDGSVISELSYTITPLSRDFVVGDMVIDSSDNIYLTGVYTDSTAPTILVAKIDSSFVFQWGNTYRDDYTSGGATSSNGIALDSSGNVYNIGYTTNSGGVIPREIFIAKHNSSGTLLSIKTIETEFDADNDDGREMFGLHIDSLDRIYFSGYVEFNGDGGAEQTFFGRVDNTAYAVFDSGESASAGERFLLYHDRGARVESTVGVTTTANTTTVANSNYAIVSKSYTEGNGSSTFNKYSYVPPF